MIQDNISSALIGMKVHINELPEPHRQKLLDNYNILRDTLLKNIASLIDNNRTSVALLEQAMADVKYMAFDLEATKRERDDLQRQLEG